MIVFDKRLFRQMHFTKEQISQFESAARHDLDIALGSDVTDVIFKFTYDALIKLAIALIARKGYKVRSSAGHHMAVLEKLSYLLNDRDIVVYGNKMRQERNANLYDGGFFVSEKDTDEYLCFAKNVFEKAGV